MNAAPKPYTAPKLEALSLRETRGINIGIGINLGGLGS